MRVNLLVAAVAAVFMVTGVSVQDAAAKPGATTVKKSPVTKKAPAKKGLTGTTAPGKRDMKKGMTKGVKPVGAKKPALRSAAINSGGVKPMAKPAAAATIAGKPALNKPRPGGLHGAAGKPAARKGMVKEGHPAARRPSVKPTVERPDVKKPRHPDTGAKVNAADIQKKAFPRKSATK